MSGYTDEQLTFEARNAALQLAMARARDVDPEGRRISEEAIVSMAALFVDFLNTGEWTP